MLAVGGAAALATWAPATCIGSRDVNHHTVAAATRPPLATRIDRRPGHAGGGLRCERTALAPGGSGERHGQPVVSPPSSHTIFSFISRWLSEPYSHENQAWWLAYFGAESQIELRPAVVV